MSDDKKYKTLREIAEEQANQNDESLDSEAPAPKITKLVHNPNAQKREDEWKTVEVEDTHKKAKSKKKKRTPGAPPSPGDGLKRE